MDDIESKISAILSSPESMEQIRNIAKSLSAGGEINNSPPQESAVPELPMDPKIMQLLTKVMGEYSKPSESSALLFALRPYLSADKVKKLDRAINIAKLARLAKTILPELGGDKHV